MGQAKKRGTFEDRKKQAIEADRQIKLAQAKTPQPIATRRNKSTTSLLLAAALAVSASRVISSN